MVDEVTSLVIVCLLGDPTLPAVSVNKTGGFQVDVQELLEHLLDFKGKIYIITNTSIYRKSTRDKYKNADLFRIRFKNSWMENQNDLMDNIERIKEEFFNILLSIESKNPLIHSFYWLSGILANEAKQKYGISYVHTVVSLSEGKIQSGMVPYYQYQRVYENQFLKNADHVFSITENEAQLLISHYHLNPRNITVTGRGVHPYIENPCRDKDGIPNNITYHAPISIADCKWWLQGAFTFIGRLEKVKGLDCIIIAWSNLFQKYQAETPPLWICGGSPVEIQKFRKNLFQYIDEKTIIYFENIQKIIWWGYLDAAGISTLFLKSNVLVTHSQYEAGGRVAIEAMSAGVPVIATKDGFAKDMIQNGYNGFLCEYGNVNRLSECMEYFILDKSKWCQMGENARITYQKFKLQWNCYNKIFTTYEQIWIRDSTTL